MRGGFEIDGAHIARRDQVDAGLPRSAQHDAAAAHIGEAGAGKQRVVDAGGNVGRAVGGVLQMYRQLAQVGIVVLEHDLLHRRLLRRHFDGRMQAVEPRREGGQQTALVGVERAGEPRPRGHHIADQLGLFRPRRLEQHRAWVAVEDAAHIDQVDGRVVHLALAGIDQLVDEIAQPKALGIDRGHGTSSCLTAI